MKKLKLGFTIAEVSTALALVGIVAAVVMPLVVNSMQKQQAGPILAKAVQQIELGCMNMIQIANSNVVDGSQGSLLGDFKQYELDPSRSTQYPDAQLPFFNFEKLAAPYMGLQYLELTSQELFDFYNNIKYFNGAQAGIDKIAIGSADKFIFTKIPAAVYMMGMNGSFMYEDPDDLVANVYIDTNGLKKPNTFGKDIFRFELKNSCKMVPYGLSNSDHYKNNCSDTRIKDGKACAARVVADGFKIKYY